MNREQYEFTELMCFFENFVLFENFEMFYFFMFFEFFFSYSDDSNEIRLKRDGRMECRNGTEWNGTNATPFYIQTRNSGHYVPFLLAPPEGFEDHWGIS